MTTKKLTFRQKILVAGTLFGMFFGAGNLIFPVHLGQMAGRNAVVAMIGFIITAVGIPIMGVAAIGNTHSDGLQQLSNKVGKGYGYVFSCLLYLTIGPGFAIPRCATTSFTVGVAPMLGAGTSESIALLIFSVIFFAIVLILSLRPGEITVWIGKVITPIFLVFLAILVVTALINPSTSVSDVEPAAGYQTGALSLGFIEGYNTMDAIAGLAFGIVVIDIIRSMGVTDDSDHFSHSESGKDSSDSKPVEAAEKEKCHGCCHSKTYHIKGYLYFRIAHLGYVGKLSWEKVCRNNRKLTAVREGYTNTQEKITYHKIYNSPTECSRKYVNPRLIQVEEHAESEADNEAEQVHRNEFFPHNHKA